MYTTGLTAKYEDEMIAIRRHIHRHPELSNKEYKTTEFIREKLTEYGVEIAEIGMKTGVVAVIRGGKPGKTVAIREDIDEVPNSQDFRSPPRMMVPAIPADMISTQPCFSTARRYYQRSVRSLPERSC